MSLKIQHLLKSSDINILMVNILWTATEKTDKFSVFGVTSWEVTCHIL